MSMAGLSKSEIEDAVGLQGGKRALRQKVVRYVPPEAAGRRKGYFTVDAARDRIIDDWAERYRTTRSGALALLIDRATRGER